MQTIPEIPYSFYIAALPVLLLCVGSLISLLQSAYSAQERSIVIVLFTFLGAALLSALLPAELDSYLGGAYLVDSLARFGQIFMLATTLGIAVVFHQTYLRGKFFQGEIASLYQMIVAGMVVFVYSNYLITFFI
jgi:NADH:ubiquinone oxidoreductase subunit 2 (subunit N)